MPTQFMQQVFLSSLSLNPNFFSSSLRNGNVSLGKKTPLYFWLPHAGHTDMEAEAYVSIRHWGEFKTPAT